MSSGTYSVMPRQAKPLPIGERTDAVFANLPAYVFPVAKKHYRDLLGWSRWFYGGDDFPCLQIVWPDRAGRFPWEPTFTLSSGRTSRTLPSEDG